MYGGLRIIVMSAIKTAAAVALQRGYRDHLEHRAAVIVSEIELRVAELQALPTTRLDAVAAAVGLQLSSPLPDISFVSGACGAAARRRGPVSDGWLRR